MAWFQVDDQLAMHRKVCEAGNAAMGLWVRAGSWSMQNLTEGHIPTKIARTLGTAGQAANLVAAGLWVAVDTGYQFHEWGTRQMSAETISERRRKRAEAGRKGGQSRGGGQAKPEANASADDQANAQANSKPNGTPVLVPALVGVTWRENETLGNAGELTNEPPSEFCSKHPRGTDDNCGGCRNARRRSEGWHLQFAEAASLRIVERRREIRECPDCDENGLTVIGNIAARCPKHDWSSINA